MSEKESKKRKRQSNGLDAPHKKVAVDTTQASKIKVVFNNEDGLCPVLISAPGLTTPNLPFKPYTRALSTKVNPSDVPKPDTHELMLHSSQHPRLDYTASSVALDQNLAHYVAIYEPATNQIEIKRAHHLSLRSGLRREDKGEDKQRQTFRQQREELGREFGTKKAKKAIADKFVNAIVKDGNSKGKKNDVEEAVLASMADMVSAVPKEEEKLEAALASKPIPKPNLEAENVEDVYTYNTLLPPTDARLVPIKDWLEKTQAEENIELKHRFPAYRIQALGTSGDTSRLKSLRYLALLLEFHDVLANAGRSGKKVPKKDLLQKKLDGWPENLIDAVRRRFANASNELPKWHMDNLYAHMCALSLYVDGWTTDTTDLKEDLKMENKEITQYFRELGCRVAAPTEAERERRKLTKAQAGVRRIARLKLPLEFPKARTARRK